MKILMVSMVSIHFTRWVEQLKDSGHEIYWFDPLDGTYDNKNLNWIHYCKQWRLRWNFPGRYYVKNKIPWLYKYIKRINERPIAKAFEAYLNEVKPDVVHSFVMYMSCAPILSVMQNNKHVKWIYSAWGNDLYFYQNNQERLEEIKSCLPRLNYMFADCARDINIARNYGFSGIVLGVFPTGGGYHLQSLAKFTNKLSQRNTILIKGYEHHFGRCNVVLKALTFIRDNLSKYKIIVYSANEKVIKFTKDNGLNAWPNFKLLGKVTQDDLFKLKGEALIYIGNSISDGMPNSLLEAIIMGAFPIQSNPGGATEEITEDGVNGLLINDPLNSKEIAELILRVLESPSMIRNAFDYNLQLSKTLDYNFIKSKVIEAYQLVNQNVQ